MRLDNGLICLMLAALLILPGCGGGGGSAGTIPGAATGSNTSTGTGIGTGTGTITVPVVSSPRVSAIIVNQSGATVTSIAVGGGYAVRATVVDGSGVAVAAKLVTFSLNGSLVANVAPATALTNSSGIAEVAITPSSISSAGAATAVATSDFSGATVSGQVDFSVAATSLSLSAINVGNTSLPSGGNTSLQTTALVGGVASVGIPVNVTFSASCGRINNSNSSAGVSVTTDGSGSAAATYTAVAADGSLCSGAVTLTASSAGARTQSTSVNVSIPTANAVTFVSATPGQIFVSGAGSAEQSQVIFRVISSAGTVLPNVPVRFTIQTNPGGVGIGSTGSVSAVTSTSDSSGLASVVVFSGTIPGPVKVRAALVSDAAVFAESQNLTVSSGPPSQRFMSLAVQTFNIEGWTLDGSSTQLTARIADRQGNAVEDGTVINFTAEGGQIAPSCATARVLGISQCSVTFISQNPKPAGGRISVLAYTEGTKDYVDVNGNNRYDSSADTLILTGNAYRDDNENGAYESSLGEFVVPRGGSLTCPGAGEPFPSVANTCDSSLSTTVRQQAVILFSSTQPFFELISSSTSGISFFLRSVDNRLLPMPAGTAVTATTIDSNSQDGLTCSIALAPASPIPNVNPTSNPLADLATANFVGLKDCVAGDAVTIQVTAPSGLITTRTFPL